MPTTRRKAAGKAASGSKPKAAQNQAKLTFHGRVSKPGAADTPDKKAAALKADKLEAPDLEPADIIVDEEQTTSADSSLLEDGVVETVDEPLDPDEVLARKVSEAKIKSYWEEKEQVMRAPRAHLEGLSLHEKLLRQWDIDNRYGVSFARDILLPPLTLTSIAVHGHGQDAAMEARE
jgi:DNA polymerase delta subunit 4